MKRLPSYDRGTRDSEAAVFLSLSLAGLAMLSLAVTEVVKPVNAVDGTAAGLTDESGWLIADPAFKAGTVTPTNLTFTDDRDLSPLL